MRHRLSRSLERASWSRSTVNDGPGMPTNLSLGPPCLARAGTGRLSRSTILAADRGRHTRRAYRYRAIRNGFSSLSSDIGLTRTVERASKGKGREKRCKRSKSPSSHLLGIESGSKLPIDRGIKTISGERRHRATARKGRGDLEMDDHFRLS